MGANQSNVSVEMIESDYPIRLNQYGMVPDTSGPGRFRGGLSLCREYEILADRSTIILIYFLLERPSLSGALREAKAGIFV